MERHTMFIDWKSDIVTMSILPNQTYLDSYKNPNNLLCRYTQDYSKTYMERQKN